MTDNSTKERTHEIYKTTIIGSIVNLTLIVFKFFAGTFGHSAAMIADASHSLSDFVSDIIVLLFIKVSNKPRDHDHNYGHGKFETLASLLIGVILLLVGVGMAWNGIKLIIAIYKGATMPSVGIIALIGALSSIVFKELLFRYTLAQGKKINSDVVIANAWHHRSDSFSSIATAIGISGAIFLSDKWAFLDPLSAILVSLLIIKSAYHIAKPNLDELLEKSLPENIKEDIIQTVSEHSYVSHLHNLRTRKIGNYYAIEFHIRLDGTMPLKEAHELISQIEAKLYQQYGSQSYITIHMEPIK